MKKLIFFGAAATALIAAPAASQPQRGPAAGAGLDRAQIESRVAASFARIDANRDGFVTREEAEGARAAVRAQRTQRMSERRAAMFDRLDADRNGAISREEFTAPRGQRAERGDRGGQRAERGERRGQRFAGRGMRGGTRGGMGAGFGGEGFARMDADGDGRVSLAEATRFRLERFDRIDANHDGRIDREEVQAVRAQRQTR